MQSPLPGRERDGEHYKRGDYRDRTITFTTLRGKMKIWQCVVWLSAVTLEVAQSQSPDREGWIREAVDLYNQRDDGEFLFKLLSDLPGPLLEEEGDSPAIGFLIKETDCPKTEEKDLEGCDYSKDGEVKVCALYQEDEDVKCVSLTKAALMGMDEGGTDEAALMGTDRLH